MHRKILIGLALAASAAYLVAQSGVVSSRGGATRSAQGEEQLFSIAQKDENRMNAAQDALQHYIVADTNYYVDLAEEQGRNTAVSKVIEAQCYNLLTLMNDAQRDHDANAVWQVKVW